MEPVLLYDTTLRDVTQRENITFSPDGSRIAFTSDRGGGDNIWLMNADGSDMRQLTDEDFRLLNQLRYAHPDSLEAVLRGHAAPAFALSFPAPDSQLRPRWPRPAVCS